MSRKNILMMALAVGSLSISVFILQANQAQADPPEGAFSYEDAQAFQDFPLYYAGDTILGLSMNYVIKQPINQLAEYWKPGDPARDTVSFIYGTCEIEADDEIACPAPIEVQVWPACVRNPSWYANQDFPTPDNVIIRGVPAAFFEEGARVEIQTGISTVVIFGPGESAVSDVANALRGVNNSTPPTGSLPAPAAGSLNGTLAC